MRQCRSLAFPWSLIGIVMPLFVAEPRSVPGLLFTSRYLWNDLADPVFDGVGLVGFRAWQIYYPKRLASFLSSDFFPFSYFSLLLDFVGLWSSD